MHVGIAGVVTDLLALDPRPCRRRDDLARLGGDIAEADLDVLLPLGQVRMFAPRCLAELLPGLDGNLAVGLGRQHQDHLGGVDIGVDPRLPLGRPVQLHAVQVAQVLHLGLGVPGDALAAVADVTISGPSAVNRS